MARYKVMVRSPRFVPIVLEAQLVTGSFEYALDYLVDHEIDLSELDRRYSNEMTRAFRPTSRRCCSRSFCWRIAAE